ncbi:hypothetical protein BGZ98_008150 [Dissophora globulifera]|nr:hypothetical protein BGZ98_008150 [Dissophora globulifera]
MTSYFHLTGSGGSRGGALQANGVLPPGQLLQQRGRASNTDYYNDGSDNDNDNHDNSDNSNSGSSSSGSSSGSSSNINTTGVWHDAHEGRVEVILSDNDETKTRLASPQRAMINEDAQYFERWDDAFEFDSHQPFERLLEQLGRHLPRSPLSDSSDQSDYFQEPLSKHSSIPANSSTSRLTLPTPTGTTSTPSAQSSKLTRGLLGDDHNGSSNQRTRKGPGTTSDSLVKAIAHPFYTSLVHTVHATDAVGTGNNSVGADKTLHYNIGIKKNGGEQSTRSSPNSSSSSSPRAVTASLGAPSTVATSTSSFVTKDKDGETALDKDTDTRTGRDKDKEEDESPSFPTKSMTTITQEMMLSNLPAYTGIITRINPIKRVAAWVDDLEDLEVPEDDLDFNHVRSSLAKSNSAPDTLESLDNWESGSEHSASHCSSNGNDGSLSGPIPPFIGTSSSTVLSQTSEATRRILVQSSSRSHGHKKRSEACGMSESEAVETLDDDFDLPADLGSLRLDMQARHLQRQQPRSINSTGQGQPSSQLLQWQDATSDFDDFDFGTPLDNRSLSSSISFSRDSMPDDENLMDGIVFPEAMESLQLVTNRPYRPEANPSIFSKESHFQDEQDDFWAGIEIEGDGAFSKKGRNKNLVVRAIPVGRGRSSSRVQREIVPLKDFVALPSKIPRLYRPPGDTSRPVTPAPSLSRVHSAQFELPRRNLKSKSSLPRLKRSSISRRDGARSSLVSAVSEFHLASSDVSSVCSSAVESRPSTPTTSQLLGSKRNSLSVTREASFKSSSLAMRSVSFTEPLKAMNTQEPSEPMLQITQPPSSLVSKPPLPPGNVKSFPSLRSLVRKLDLVRPRFNTRGLIPAFSPADLAVDAEPGKSSSFIDPLPAEPVVEQKVVTRGPSISRSSSFTDWGSILASTDTTKDSRPPSRAGVISLGDISEISTTDLGETIVPVVASDRFSRRLFLKRSPKHSTFGDGSELDRFDNLPTFGAQEPCREDRQRSTQVMAQVRRQSSERVAAWLRKPQSIGNFKDINKPEGTTIKNTEPELLSSVVRKSKSIRRSLFDIFAQTTISEPVKEKAERTRKKKSTSGPTLIRDLSQSRVRKVSGMVYNPKDKMWKGNDDILDEFEDEDHTPTPFEFPSPPMSHSYFSTSPLLGAIRPALISNMSQYSKQRTQVAGKMVFDPTRMCWIINPEYIAQRRQRRQGDHQRQRSMDKDWGEESDVFAGLSDSEKSEGEVQEREHGSGPDGMTVNSSIGGGGGRDHRLLSRPSFQRQSSQDYLVEEERLRAWAETMTPSTLNETSDSRPTMAGIHSVVSKSSRRSLNGVQYGNCINGISSGGYSSRGEFEVGAEFDITDAFLEQCIAVETQHRKDAGKFFALPCSPLVLNTGISTPGRLSKVLTLGKKSGRIMLMEKQAAKETERPRDNGKGKDKVKDKGKGKANVLDTSMHAKNEQVQEDPVSHENIRRKGKMHSNRPLFSWPPRNRIKSQSIVAHLASGGDGTIESVADFHDQTTSTTLFGDRSWAVGRNDRKNKTFGPASFSLFPSIFSPTPPSSPISAAPKMTGSGRGGSQQSSQHHLLPPKHDSMRSNLSISATLAVARKSAKSFDRRRIGNHTFDPLNKNIDGEYDDGAAKKVTRNLDTAEDDDLMVRGYRMTSNTRGRPPLRPRTELILEFERYAGQRYQ